MPDIKAIEFTAEVRQVKSMADNTVNITINLPEYCKDQAKIFLDWMHQQIKVIAVIENTQDDAKRHNKPTF